MVKATNQTVCYQLRIDKSLWDNFKSTLRKVYWKDGLTIDKGIIKLMEEFINKNFEK